MKVLMISGDRRLLEEGSDAFKRLALQRAQVERLDVVVWPQVHSLAHVFTMAWRGHYDIVTAQDPLWRGLFGLKIARLTGAKLDIQVHADLSAASFLRHILAQIILRQADSIRVVSEKIKKQVEATGARSKISVLPIFIDVSRFQNLPRSPHSQKTMLWIGRFEREKDPHEAIEVFKKVYAELSETKLVMLGTGSLGGALREAAAALPVEFPGWSDPAPFLQRADVVLCTSPYESYGASIVEALAAGVPVVAPDVGVAREAGAIVMARFNLANAVLEILRSGERGTLKLNLPAAEEWARAWKETLV